MQSHQLKIASLPQLYPDFQGIMEKKKRKLLSKFPLVKWSAVGETRTRTGLRPLPPQSSVSTISPPPLCFGTANICTIFTTTKFFNTFFVKS